MIRDFELRDADVIVEILKMKDQYGFPEVDGPEAMCRVKACSAAVFLVYEMEGKVVGSIRGNYDGSPSKRYRITKEKVWDGDIIPQELNDSPRNKAFATLWSMKKKARLGLVLFAP